MCKSNKQWDGYKYVDELNDEELEELRYRYANWNGLNVDDVDDSELYEHYHNTNFVCEDFWCDTH